MRLLVLIPLVHTAALARFYERDCQAQSSTYATNAGNQPRRHGKRERDGTRVSPWSSPYAVRFAVTERDWDRSSAMLAGEVGALVQAYTSQSALTVCIVALMAPLRS